jgi:nitrile hydratase
LSAAVHDRIRKVHTHHGAHMLPNASAHGEKGAERLYSIVFEVDKLWREASGLPKKALLKLYSRQNRLTAATAAILRSSNCS